MVPSTSKIVAIAKALADPTRLGMIHRLRERGECTCGEMLEACELAQPTVSHHLKILEAAGLIRVEKVGPFHRLTLNEDSLTAFVRHLDGRTLPRRTRSGASKIRKSSP